ncbi:MAG: alanine racemase domain protein [Caulobacteraceae bacterium]|nr:alanine racemase domain protein [Caulobacteraceae bacterium]
MINTIPGTLQPGALDRRAGLGPNRDLIGRPNGRKLLSTPALILDLDALEHNIGVMAAFGRKSGIALRPHAKTHKSAHIGALQRQAGAVGLCCAKLGEAEALAGEDAGPLLITSPVVGPSALARLATLCDRTDLSVVVDSEENVLALGAALQGRRLTVLIDLDPGLHRTGVPGAGAAVELARAIQDQENLRFGGLQFFSGPTQHIEDYRARSRDVEDRTANLVAVAEALRSAGFPPAVITGGGTGTHEIDARLGVMTELQVGSYVFMDDQYSTCALYPATASPFRTSLTIDTRVVSANWPGLVTVDAGLKASTGSLLPPRILSGAPEGAIYEYRGDEHGAVILPEGARAPRLGDVVSLGTPHCDPTVNLYDFYHVVRGDDLIDIWPVTARGLSS